MEGYRQQETYKIIGICMEVHRILGPGLLEIVYKDALEIEFKENNIPFEREKEFVIEYKGEILLDSSKPDGTLRKLLDVGKLKRIGWEYKINLREGIESVYKGILENNFDKKENWI